MTSAIPVQCSTKWAIKQSGRWPLCELVIYPRKWRMRMIFHFHLLFWNMFFLHLHYWKFVWLCNNSQSHTYSTHIQFGFFFLKNTATIRKISFSVFLERSVELVEIWKLTPFRFFGNFPRVCEDHSLPFPTFRRIDSISGYLMTYIFVFLASIRLSWHKPPIFTLTTRTSRIQRREVTIGRLDSSTLARLLASFQMTSMPMPISRGWAIPLSTSARKCTKGNAFLLRSRKILQVVKVKWNRISDR